MRKDDDIRLRHMLDAARQALEFVRGRTRADLDADRMLVLASVKAIEIVGEAANQVSESCRNRCPGIPWADLVGMRNRLVHAYFDINLDVLWQTVHNDIPQLITALGPVLDANKRAPEV